eukprot:1158281-Pelagomonas_calceolata.AAC.4
MRELELIKYYNVAYKYKQLTFLPCKYEIQRKIRKWSPRLTSGAHFQSPLVAEERHAKGCTTCDLCWATSQKDKHAKQEAGHAVRHSQFSATTRSQQGLLLLTPHALEVENCIEQPARRAGTWLT